MDEPRSDPTPPAATADDVLDGVAGISADASPIGQAKAATCQLQRQGLQTAVEAYIATNGQAPPRVEDAIAAFLRPDSLSAADWSIDPTTGTVQPLAGGTHTAEVVAACR